MSDSYLRNCIKLLDHLRSHGEASTADGVQLLEHLGVDRYAVRRCWSALVRLGEVERVGTGSTTTYLATGPALRRAAPSQGELLALEIGRQTLGFLRGSGVHRWAGDALSREAQHASAAEQERLTRFRSRFRVLSEPPRSFEGMEETLDDVITALRATREVRLTLDEGDPAIFRPLGLVLYRRALYLLARRDGSDEVERLPLDRIRAITVLRIFFTYPPDFDLDAELRPWFGIRKGEAPAAVVLRFKPHVARYVLVRRWHETATATPTADGGVELRMQAGGQELLRWCLEWGETVEVIEPAWLREAVVGALSAALEQYAAPQAGAPGAPAQAHISGPVPEQPPPSQAGDAGREEDLPDE